MSRTGPPRIVFQVTPEQIEVVNYHLPRGMKRIVFTAILEDLIEVLQKHEEPREFLGDIVGGKVRLRYVDGSTSTLY